jgi:hypothetical protein
MTKRLSLLFLVALLTAMAVLPGAAAAANPATGGVSAPVTGTYTDPVTGSVGSFAGVLTVARFAAQNGQLVATGTVTGLVTYTSGLLAGTTQTITSTFTGVVTASGTCKILDLTIGAIHLDLLGLVLDTNTIHLEITAQSGPGNLLGNLLCAVANLLNGGAGGSALQQLANLLNQILGQL